MNVILDIANKRWFDETEACVYTTFGRDTLRELRETNRIPFRKMGKKIVYERSHLDQYMETLELHNKGKIRTELKLKKIIV
jgi:excisionase family DNA binding protein